MLRLMNSTMANNEFMAVRFMAKTSPAVTRNKGKTMEGCGSHPILEWYV